MAETVLTAARAGKAFGGITVLRDVDLTVARGRCIAFIGHNGSGKSTLLKLLAGLIAPTTGRVERGTNLKIGYVPERFPGMELTPPAYIRHMARIEGLRDAQAAADALFRDFFLDGMLDVPMKHLSKGSLQKVGAIQALIARRDLLLLDEPLSGQEWIKIIAATSLIAIGGELVRAIARTRKQKTAERP